MLACAQLFESLLKYFSNIIFKRAWDFYCAMNKSFYDMDKYEWKKTRQARPLRPYQSCSRPRQRALPRVGRPWPGPRPQARGCFPAPPSIGSRCSLSLFWLADSVLCVPCGFLVFPDILFGVACWKMRAAASSLFWKVPGPVCEKNVLQKSLHVPPPLKVFTFQVFVSSASK